MKVKLALSFVITISFLWAADFWLAKDYTSWTQKECETILTKSPWVFSNALFQGNAFTPMGVGNSEREKTVTFRFRMLSAKPVRMAFAQLQLLGKPGDSALAGQMKQMIDTPPDKDNRIVVQLDFSVDPAGDSSVREIHSALLNSHLTDFRDSTYLSDSEKALVPLVDFRSPTPKQPNPVFIFPRVDEKGAPYFDGKEKWIAFKTEIKTGTTTYKIFARNPAEKMKFRDAFEF